MKKNIFILIGGGVLLAIIAVLFLNKPKEEITYTVTFDSNGGSNVSSQIIKNGDLANKPNNPTKDGYQFVNWMHNNLEFDFNTKIIEDITLTAKWEKENEEITKITVKFNNDGNITEKLIDQNTKIAIPNVPVKKGYTFVGWYYNNEQFDFNTEIANDIELVAKWQKENEDANEYTVTFDSNGGNKISNITVIEGNKISKPNNPTKDGYTFLYWALNDKEFNFNTPITKNITLIAKWQKENETVIKNKYTVTFDSNGGSKISSITVLEGEKISKPNNPTKDGYTFLYWALNDKEFNFNTPITTNIKLKATWKEIEKEPEFSSYGDINKDNVVNIIDALAVLRYVEGTNNLTEEQKKSADVNTDGYIDNVDYTLILGFEANYFPNTLPKKPITNYVIYGDTLNMGQQIKKIDSPMPYSVVEQYLEGNKSYLEGQALKNADVNGDGVINYIDRTIMYWFVNGEFTESIPNFIPFTNYTFYGDVNNDGLVNDKDITLLLNFVNNNASLSKQGMKNADVNADKKVNNTDYELLKKALENNYFGGNIPAVKPIS